MRRATYPAGYRVPGLAAFILVCLSLAGCGGGRSGAPGAPEVLVASDRIVHVDLALGRVLHQRLLPAPANDLVLAPGGARLAVATRRGAAFLDVQGLKVTWYEDLGILDAVELSPDGRVAYVLIHPGKDPAETNGEHRVLEIDFPSGKHGREVKLDARSYDLFVEPGGAIDVTDLVGRTVHRIDPTTFAVTDHSIGLGLPPEQEPRGAFLRVLLPGRRPGELFAVEDNRAAARLWRWEPASSRVEPHDLPGVKPPVLGGGIVGGGSKTNGELWLHTRSQFLRLGADFSVNERLALAAQDSAAAYRFAAADGSICVLLGPAPPPSRGLPQARAVWIDLARGTVAGERLLEVRAGPCVLLPRPAAATAALPAPR